MGEKLRGWERGCPWEIERESEREGERSRRWEWEREDNNDSIRLLATYRDSYQQEQEVRSNELQK